MSNIFDEPFGELRVRDMIATGELESYYLEDLLHHFNVDCPALYHFIRDAKPMTKNERQEFRAYLEKQLEHEKNTGA